MINLIVDNHPKINPKLIKQAQQYSPRIGLKKDFDNAHTQNPYVHFLKTQSIIILEQDGRLLSFAAFGLDDVFTLELASFLELDATKCIFFMYFFTPKHLRGKGYGKTLYEGILNNLKQTYPSDYFFIYTTANKDNITLYQKWGAEFCGEKTQGEEMHYCFKHALK